MQRDPLNIPHCELAVTITGLIKFVMICFRDIEDGRIEFREAEFKTLKDHILNTNKVISHRAVISIIGESGTGKTRLARKLYNDHHINDHFEVFAWICLPPHIRFEQYVEIIYDQVRTQVPKEHNQSGTPSWQVAGQSSEKLRNVLKGKKYLVVLDGLVDISQWNSLLDLLPADNPESRVVLTSKLKQEEIMHADTKTEPKVLRPLNSIHTAKLFHERVFGSDPLPAWVRRDELDETVSLKKEETMKSFEKRVYNLSRGLPLAVVVLGGVLRTKSYPSEWEDVFTEKLETLTGQPKGIRCLWSLAFEDLPPRLKSCFLYLATASQNVYLEPDRLVRLWIAEGFVSPKKSKTLEEVGLGYLKELVCRGLLEVVEKDARGGIKLVVVHSLVHSFLDSEAQESSFLEINHHANVLNPHLVRRLAIHNFVDSHINIPNQFPKLRSLLCDFLEEQQHLGGTGSNNIVHGADEPDPDVHKDWGSNIADWFLRACGHCSDPAAAAADSAKLHHLSVTRGSRFLRVIDLYGVMLATLPEEIGSIIHLRYLGVRSCRLKEFPASLSKLANLQTLDVRRTQVTHVPDGLWEINLLRHVLAEMLLLSKCPSAHLRNMQTLVGAAPAGQWLLPSCCPLNHMMYLRTLAMCCITESYVEALSSAIQRMEFLVSLSLSGDLLPSSIFSSPSSRRLEVLELDGMLDSSPESPFILPNLGKLSLSRSGNLEQDFVDDTAALPNLTEMELLDGSYVGDELVFNANGFLSLTKLYLANLEALEKLKLVAGSTPKLAVLITNCGCTSMQIIDNRNSSEVATAILPREIGTIHQVEEMIVTIPRDVVTSITRDEGFQLTEIGSLRGHARMCRAEDMSMYLTETPTSSPTVKETTENRGIPGLTVIDKRSSPEVASVISSTSNKVTISKGISPMEIRSERSNCRRAYMRRSAPKKKSRSSTVKETENGGVPGLTVTDQLFDFGDATLSTSDAMPRSRTQPFDKEEISNRIPSDTSDDEVVTSSWPTTKPVGDEEISSSLATATAATCNDLTELVHDTADK
uniref:Uncharacterized protein n=1 Tax=Avena sativa TaxID=4498 RepID=A0ACD5UIT0_AVESA